MGRGSNDSGVRRGEGGKGDNKKEKKIKAKWGVRINEDLTMNERRRRWRMIERARRERQGNS